MAPSHTGQLLPPPEACTLPYDLVLEIVARSHVVTVVRSAATCKPLHRDILSPVFIRRVCQHGGVVPPFLVGYLRLRVPNKTGGEKTISMASSCFSLVHPETPAATSFSEDHLAPFLSHRAAADLDRRSYVPLASRNGVVVLRRGSSDICVYDPMTGNQAYPPPPLDVDKFCLDRYWVCTYVLLTAADSVGCSFLLVATDSSVSRIQTVSSAAAADGTWGWGPVISVDEPDRFRPWEVNVQVLEPPHRCAVVLNGLIHWLMCRGSYDHVDFHIRTYDVPRHGKRAATTTGSIEVPKACLPDSCEESDLHLTSSPDGRLSLLVADRFAISVWLLAGRTDWARQSVIDTEAIVRSVSPHGELPQSEWPSMVAFVRSVGVRSGAVLLRPFMNWDLLNDKGEKGLLLLDVGTGEMRIVNKEGFLYEVDMEARLSAMNFFFFEPGHENFRLV